MRNNSEYSVFLVQEKRINRQLQADSSLLKVTSQVIQ